MRTYSAVIERCPQTGLLVGFVPGFPGAHSQGETPEELNRNLQEVIAIPYKLGFFEVRQRGLHKQFRDSGGRCTTVPVHQGRDISPVLLRQVAKDIGLTLDELLRQR